MKRFICLLLTIIISIFFLTTTADGVFYESPCEIEGYTYNDMEYIQTQIAEKEVLMAAAHDMAAAARALGYDDTHAVILLAKEEYRTYYQEKENLEAIYNELNARWESKRLEYPEATIVWECLKDAGYSEYVCAGILGNIMTEVGGNTLAIQPLLQTTEYYGMCQWSSYYPGAWGLSVKEQCDYLLNSIEEEITTFGRLYQGGMTYEKFVMMTDCRQIALCFAKAYERCSPGSYGMRQDNAVTAYNYFVK